MNECFDWILQFLMFIPSMNANRHFHFYITIVNLSAYVDHFVVFIFLVVVSFVWRFSSYWFRLTNSFFFSHWIYAPFDDMNMKHLKKKEQINKFHFRNKRVEDIKKEKEIYVRCVPFYSFNCLWIMFSCGFLSM